MAVGLNPIHINAQINEIAPLVVMSGDPLRAKYIAENFLTDFKEVTNLRGMLGFTGMYKGQQITVMGHGMGMPSMSIYAFELFHFYDVQKIIRIGTCGTLNKKIDLNHLILADRVYTESKFAFTYNGYNKDVVESSVELNNQIKATANDLGLNSKFHTGMIMTLDVFGPYVNEEAILGRIPKEYNVVGEEMEAFALVHIANSLNRQASVITTVVDSKFSNSIISPEDRQTALNDMIVLALESIIK